MRGRGLGLSMLCLMALSPGGCATTGGHDLDSAQAEPLEAVAATAAAFGALVGLLFLADGYGCVQTHHCGYAEWDSGSNYDLVREWNCKR
jgi:hypothetical protein